MDYKTPLSMNTVTVFAPCFIAFVYILFQSLRTSKSKLDSLPKVGSVGKANYQDDLLDAHAKYPDTAYFVPDIETVILPIRYLDEIKNLPESKVSFTQGIYQRFMGKHSFIGNKVEDIVHSVKVDLTRNIARTLEALQDETNHAIPECIGDCQDWTPVQFYPKILRVIALLSGRVFVGLPLSRDEEWIDSTVNYTVAAFEVVSPVQKLSPWTRNLFAPSLPEVKRVRAYRKRGAELLIPILKERRERMKESHFEPPADMIQFLIQNSPKGLADDALHQSLCQMTLSFAAIHTTAMNITQAIYDLASHPEYVVPLREELEEVLAADNGILVKTSMTKLHKMDSFLKESQRMNPPNAVSLVRRVISDLTLSDGLSIPKGTMVGINSLAVYRNPVTFPSPEEFQPFRFSDLRASPENANKHQLVTTGKESLAFGHGTHACPGRFFASNEIKVLFASLIQKYDIRLKEGQGRPENMNGKTTIGPNQVAEVLFRNRK